MKPERNNKLFAKVLLVGVFIAILSYLFHPEVGHLSIMINDKPVGEPLTHFAAVPIFLAITGLAVILTILLFMGISVFLFFGTLFFAFMVCLVIAPYFWPVLTIIFLIIALMAFGHEKD
jgi:hypothetical protein